MAVNWLAADAALLAGTTLVLRAKALIVAPVALLACAWVTMCGGGTREDTQRIDLLLEIARARADEVDSALQAPPLVTVARNATTRPFTTVLLVALPLGVDAVAGRIGIASALAAGAMASWMGNAVAVSSEITRWERESTQWIFTEPSRNPLPRRGYFTTSAERASLASRPTEYQWRRS